MGARKQVRERLKQLSPKQLKQQVPRDEESAPIGDSYDKGSFTYGYCKGCDWVGTARRARDKARRDALEHAELCAGKHKPRVGTTDARSKKREPLDGPAPTPSKKDASSTS